MPTDYLSKITEKLRANNIYLIIFLFLLTFMTCVMSGTQWMSKDAYQILNWGEGVKYAVLILTFLGAHEFGHYFAARYHKVKVTLPYFIPFPFPTLNFGTFGAVIKILEPIPNRKALFDIGIAGPLSGFIVALSYLIYGYISLPDLNYLLKFHPQYLIQGYIPQTGLFFGDSILVSILPMLFKNPNGFLPPLNEIYHYPFLNVGWFGLFVTTLNLLPIGQLDGGHIVYAMFGKAHAKIARIAWKLTLFFGLFGLLGLFYDFLRYDNSYNFIQLIKPYLLPPLEFIDKHLHFLYRIWIGWLAWSVITKFVIKLDHPPIHDETELGSFRFFLGFVAFLILILSFSYNGIYFIENL